MKQILNFACLLTLSITLGCGGDLAGVKMKESINKSRPDNSASTKPAPTLAASDRTALVFNELNRIQRTLMNLSSPPPSPADSTKSCVKYVSTPKEKGIFLVARYENCHWTQAFSTEKDGILFAYRGREEFTTTGEKAQSRVTFDMAMARPSAPRTPIDRSNVEHVVVISGAGDTKSVRAESISGSETKKASSFWKLLMTDGEWIQTGPRSLKMKAGSALTWTYRPANRPAIQLILSANDEIVFGSTCPWPIRGHFELREVDQNGDDKIGQLEVTAKGYIGEDKELHPWPTNHCLGLPVGSF